MSFFDTLLWPIMVVVAWIMVQFHSLLTRLGIAADSGAGWVLSIVGLVIVIRIVLIPLFVKQIKASRGLQLIQPQMQKIQAKYKGKTDPASRQAMQQEMMALYKEHGTNPFASCLPILAQSPVFFALFRVLYTLPEVGSGTMANGRDSIGPLTQELAASAEQSTLFGAPLSSTFMRAGDFGGSALSVQIVSVVLIILMSATTFLTQRQLTMKNMPPSALDNPFARQQKMLMYLLPIIFAVTGVNFPIGVLMYWFTTNLWTMGQQFYVIRRMPTPGSAAEEALRARKARRAGRRGRPLPEEQAASPATAEMPKPSGQRPQPRRKDRQRPAPSGAAGQRVSQARDERESTGPESTEPGLAEPNRAEPGRAEAGPGSPGGGTPAPGQGAGRTGAGSAPRPRRPRATASGERVRQQGQSNTRSKGGGSSATNRPPRRRSSPPGSGTNRPPEP
jgi:YidC/Oxa1 family membrane protein insertase